MSSCRRRAGERQALLQLEQLETRQLLSGFMPSAVEQLFLEQLNDARVNPAAYGNSIGLDLSSVAPSPPLAFNSNLIEAARLHSVDMNANGYFAHISPQGLDPGARMTAAGFTWTSWGESIAGGTAYPGPSDALKGLIVDRGVPDLGHRIQLLAMTPAFAAQNEVGIGIVQAGTGPLTNYYTIDTASPPIPATFLTGSVFSDSSGNGKYEIGEGIAAVTINAALMGSSSVYSTTTWDSGGYTLALGPGTYVVTASGGGLAAPILRTVTIGSQNARVNFSPQDDAYIAHLYVTALGRSASNAEVAFWDTVLQGWTGPAGVASGINHSAEALKRIVDGWYLSYLGRSPHNGEEQGWVLLLERGSTEESVLSGILASQEFYSRQAALNSSVTSDQAYLQSLYTQLLQRTPSAVEVSNWLALLPSAGRAGIAEGFVLSSEFRQSQVYADYNTILHRSPMPSLAEVSLWVNSGLSLMEISVGIESSYEFFAHS
jgi:hypothetical protein